MSQNYSQLSMDQRRTIFKLLEAGRSKTEIANHIGRHRSTVFREIHRNTYLHKDAFLRGYFHVNAQEFAQRRRTKLKKLNRYPDLCAYVINRLEDGWSPDQISGFLKRLSLDGFYACRETVYSFIYSSEGRALKLYRFLRHSFKNRRKRYRRTPRNRRGIPESLAIRHRPEKIKDRDNFGHWEGDLVHFKRENGKANLTTLVERKSRYTIIVRNKDKKTQGVMSKIRDKLKALPQHSRQSVTFDRGSEFLAYKLLNKHVPLGSYYCDPSSPWQKGTNENTNGRIRKFLPSNTNINELTDPQINNVAKRINQTPHEVFYNHLHQHNNQIPCLT